MLEDFRLRVFVTVAQIGSFSKAARHLKISQPAVSQHISELEKQTGVRLFVRHAGETMLTAQGNVFLKDAQRILSEYSRMNSMFSNLPAAQVKVYASEDVYDYVMSELLADFRTVHPEVIFLKSFPDEADIQMCLVPDQMSGGKFSIAFHPSDSFASTHLWETISRFL